MQQHFSRLPDMSSEDSSFPEVDATLYQLLSAFLEVLRKAPAKTGLVIDRRNSISAKYGQDLDCMGIEWNRALVALLGQRQSRLYLIVTFLALLELIRQGVLRG